MNIDCARSNASSPEACLRWLQPPRSNWVSISGTWTWCVRWDLRARSVHSLQRVGRSGHFKGGVPKGRLFPLSRDELVEAIALLDAVRRGELDELKIPEAPLDILAQQIVAAAGAQLEGWSEDDLFALAKGAYPYRKLTRDNFNAVVRMLADGFSTTRGRRSAHIHHDAVNRRFRGRRGARLAAITSGWSHPRQCRLRGKPAAAGGARWEQ